MVYCVVAVHDRKHYTERFLQALKKQTVNDIQLVLVDDGSTDGTTDMVKQYYPTATTIRGPGNWWWTRSMQKGVEYVLTVAKDGDYVLCGNNDQIAEPTALAALIAASKKYEGAIVGSISKKFDDPQTVFDSAYTIDWAYYGKNNPIPIAQSGEYAGSIDVLSCRFTIIPIAVLRQINFNGKRFPHYLGDNDLFLQAKKKGFRLILSYDSVIYDIGGISGVDKKGALRLKQLMTNMFSVRSHNNVIFMARYFWYDCPKFWHKMKLLILMANYYLYLMTKAFFLSVFGWDVKAPWRRS